MKKILNIAYILVATSFLAASCSEWDPVVNIGYDQPEDLPYPDIKANISIASVKAMYVDKPVHIEKDLIIGGQVTSSDQSGNIYRSMYIQDATGAIEIKIGKSSLYNDYRPGQWVYVKLNGLTLGTYEGMLQIGLDDPSGEYETAYIDVQRMIDLHVFKGKIDTPVVPIVLSESEILLEQNMEKLVTLKGLKYANEAFALLYPDPNGDKKSTANRVFLSDKTWGITTWAMSKNKMQAYLDSGIWDEAKTADGAKTVAELRKENAIEATGTYVSQYFKMGSKEIQIRTSGYAKFADVELDEGVLNGTKLIDITGILTNYRGSAQFTLIDLDGVKIYSAE
ncbi:MAG: hypothetical protein IKX26_07250 [Bacteroidales bacterium]|nr:hypothetical protein [Bacteroidales bacterium]